MSAINLPNNLVNDTDADADQVMANFQAITQVANGALEADSNIQVAAPVTQRGQSNNEGIASTLLRSDATFIVQGCENLSGDPTTGNFKSRWYWNTTLNQLRVCTDDAGVGTFVPYANLLATDLVVHAAQHKDGGHDPLPDNILTDHMFAAKTNTFAATLGSDVTTVATIASDTYTTIQDLSVSTTGAQTLLVTLNVIASAAAAGGDRSVILRVRDQHNATGDTNTPVTIWRTDENTVPMGGILTLGPSFTYTTPSLGLTRTLRLSACVDAAANFQISKPIARAGDSSETIVTISAVVV